MPEQTMPQLQIAKLQAAHLAILCRFARDAVSLLDLACGRGGDLWKWLDANVRLYLPNRALSY